MIIFTILFTIIILLLFKQTFHEQFTNHTYELKDNFKLCKPGHEIKSDEECLNAAHLLKLNPAGGIQKTNNTPPGCSFDSFSKDKNLFWNSSLNGQAKYNISPICNKWAELEEEPTIIDHLNKINSEILEMKKEKKIPKLPIEFNIKTKYIKNNDLNNPKIFF